MPHSSSNLFEPLSCGKRGAGPLHHGKSLEVLLQRCGSFALKVESSATPLVRPVVVRKRHQGINPPADADGASRVRLVRGAGGT